MPRSLLLLLLQLQLLHHLPVSAPHSTEQRCVHRHPAHSSMGDPSTFTWRGQPAVAHCVWERRDIGVESARIRSAVSSLPSAEFNLNIKDKQLKISNEQYLVGQLDNYADPLPVSVRREATPLMGKPTLAQQSTHSKQTSAFNIP